ncbi:MAG: NAD(+) synthase [Porphyromonas sp.]|nr:NAD(+) synthase [Porphyromonas sp.]
MRYGYVKVAAAVPFVKVADCQYNIERTEQMVRQAEAQGVEMMTFPELSITGYTCGDLFLQPHLLEEAEKALCTLAKRTEDTNVFFIVGMPLRAEEKLYNAAVALQGGKILGAIPKTYLPNYREFQEKRWFSSSSELAYSTIRIGHQDVPIGHDLIFKHGDLGVGVEICEDMWTPVTPGTRLALYGAHIIFNLSASNENAGKNSYLRSLISALSSQGIVGYVYSSCGFGESSTDLVYTGKAFIAENGVMISETERFVPTERMIVSDIDVERIRTERLINSSFRTAASEFAWDKLSVIEFDLNEEDRGFEMTRPIERNPFIPSTCDQSERCQEMFDIQVAGLAQRLNHLKNSKIVIGISGGLDSTLALLVAVRAMNYLGRDIKDVIGVVMPGLGTSDRTHQNAIKMLKLLGVTLREISIKEATLQHLEAIGHDGHTPDVTFENAQARERTQVLMDVANMEGGFVLGTGDLSELALGWTTFNGDHASMYNVNATIPKTSVRLIVEYLASRPEQDPELSEVLMDVIATPVSPELTRKGDDITQYTEHILGPYEVHDFYLYHFLQNAYSPQKIFYMAKKAFKGEYTHDQLKGWMLTFFKRFFAYQYKRNFMPDGPKVGVVSLSPRGNWRMISDASAQLWLDTISNF